MIADSLILEAQKAWGEGIVKIGKAFLEKEDYKAAAEAHIHEFYNYQEGTVLFKPTLTCEKQFRLNFEGALSYFVGGNDNYPEDHGFAIKPWSNVRWENIGTKVTGDMGVAMGNYYFTDNNKKTLKVEYTFGFIKVKKNELRINLHHSSLPYND